MTRRTERLNHLLRQEISQLIQHHLMDPRLDGLISVTEVEISTDLKQAQVYVSVLAEEEQKRKTFRGLKAASGYLRHHLAHRLVMRAVPELQFILDESLARGDHLTGLIREVASDLIKPPSDER